MEVHVLNGDALAGGFPFRGEIIICRECLIEGPIQAPTLEEFWNTRASYLSDAFNGHGPSYFTDVSSELCKLQKQKPDAAINLWFEHDLFCQANLWFILHLLRDSRFSGSVYRVIPPTDGKDLWSGFGPMNEQDLEQCFRSRITLSPDDLLFGASLWDAYQAHDLAQLKTLSITVPGFLSLSERSLRSTYSAIQCIRHWSPARSFEANYQQRCNGLQ
jgi:hypothetical protein